MLNKKLVSIFNEITNVTGNMVTTYVDKKNLTGKVDFASVYAQSSEEFAQLTKIVETNGSLADVQPTGNYYWLNEPLKTKIGTIRRCRVRIYDSEHQERGYNDFEVVDYEGFKKKYLQKPYFILLENKKVEMIELKVPGYNVRAYFPNIKF